jgi:hypothetical protein
MRHAGNRPQLTQRSRDGARQLRLALFGLGLMGGLRAEVEWQARLVRLEPPAGAVEAVGEFVFTNRGADAVRVVDVRSSCECTVPDLAKRVFQPGEQGKIPVVFHVGTRQGRQAVNVTVTTHEPALRTHNLTLEVDLKEFALLTPRLLYWKVGDEPAAKVLQLTLADGFRLAGVESASPDFSVEALGAVGLTAQLRVKPRDTWAKRQGLIKIKVVQGAQPPLEVLAPVRVQ